MLNSNTNFEREYNLSGYEENGDLSSPDASELNISHYRFRSHPWTDNFPSRRGSQHMNPNPDKSDSHKFQKKGRNNV